MSWTLLHSVAMLVLALLSWAAGNAIVVAVGGAVSLGVFVLLRRSAWSADGRFGGANAVTALRAALVVVLGALPQVGPVAASLVLFVFALDGIDGWLARRGAGGTPFGATFDMETDALLVLVAGLKLHESGRLGPWILLPGALRYVYAVAVAALPTSYGEAPRSRLARYVFAIVVASFVASLWPVSPLHPWFAAVATILLVVSFARSAFWSFRPGVRRLA